MKVKRTISYLRADWGPDAAGQELESELTRALQQLPNVVDTRLPSGSGEAAIYDRRMSPSGWLLHIARWRDGQQAPTVPLATSKPSIRLRHQDPEQHWNYWNAGGMLMAWKNHCLLMPNGLPAKSMERYVRDLLLHAEAGRGGAVGRSMYEDFRLVPIADPQVARRIREEGVKKIDFHIGQYIHVAQDMVRPTILRELGAALGTIFGRDIPIEQLAEAANLNAKLVLAIDGRRVAGLQPEDFGPVVQRIVDDDDEGSVDLVTKHDHIIRRGDLVLRQTVEVERFLNTNTVNHGDAWDQMRDYMRKLSQDGALDQ